MENSSQKSESLSSEAPALSSNDLTRSTSNNETKLTRKKSVRIVQSRYMSCHTADPANKSMLKKDSAATNSVKKVPTLKKGSASSVKKIVNTNSGPIKKDKEQKQDLQPDDDANCKELFDSTTMSVEGTSKPKRVVSTPVGNKSSASLPSFEQSAISSDIPTVRSNLGPAMTTRPKNAFRTKLNYSTVSNAGPVVAHHSDTKNLNSKEVQEQPTLTDLIISRGRYLQCVHLDVEPEKALKMREHSALDQLFQLWQLNMLLSEKKAKLQKSIQKMESYIKLEELAVDQAERLAPVMKLVGKFDSQFSKLALSLEKARHQLQLKGFEWPLDKNYEESIIQAITECIEVLESGFESKEASIWETSDLIRKIDDDIGTLATEIKSCMPLLEEYHQLMAEESSLRIDQNNNNV